MVDAALFAEFSRTREQHELVGRALVPLVERMALELVAEVLLGTHTIRARQLAVELFCAIEGAFLLCRASRSTEALQVVGAASAAAVRAAL